MTATENRTVSVPPVVLLTLVLAVVCLPILAWILATSSGSKTVEGSGNAATQVRRVPGFTRVELAGANNVVVRVGGKQSVAVRGDENLLDRVTTTVRAGTLVIRTRGSFSTRVPMSVAIRVPSLEGLTLSGNGMISAEGIQSRQLTVALPGSGALQVSGVVTRLDVAVDGSGDAQLGRLAAENVRAVIRGSGRIVVDAVNALDASVEGTGVIVYGGHPAHVTTSVTGTGTIIRG
jgi:hypothetical protein